MVSREIVASSGSIRQRFATGRTFSAVAQGTAPFGIWAWCAERRGRSPTALRTPLFRAANYDRDLAMPLETTPR
jgi:hypothetical protein